MKQILIIYNNSSDYLLTHPVEGIKEAIALLGKYVGAGDLFQKALIGAETTEEMVKMFNHFSMYSIDVIYAIDSTLYVG